jgi:hypothetical protein
MREGSGFLGYYLLIFSTISLLSLLDYFLRVYQWFEKAYPLPDSSTPPDEKSGRVRGIFNFKTRSVGGKTPSKSKRLPHTKTPERSVSASLISTLKRS